MNRFDGIGIIHIMSNVPKSTWRGSQYIFNDGRLEGMVVSITQADSSVIPLRYENLRKGGSLERCVPFVYRRTGPLYELFYDR